MHSPNTMYSPHRKVTPVIQPGVTIEEIEAALTQITGRKWHEKNQYEMRNYCVYFAILKVGCSIQKLMDFTHYERPFLFDLIEKLRAGGWLITGTLSHQFVLWRVPGSEELIERITGQRIPKQESTNMSKVEPGAAAEAALEAASAKPKCKYSKRKSKVQQPKGDGTLRIKKPSPSPLDKAGDALRDALWNILYADQNNTIPAELFRDAYKAIIAHDKQKGAIT